MKAAAGAPVMPSLSANPGCRLPLAGGSLLPVRHPLEILAGYLA
jgi:hypothetical protein